MTATRNLAVQALEPFPTIAEGDPLPANTPGGGACRWARGTSNTPPGMGA